MEDIVDMSRRDLSKMLVDITQKLNEGKLKLLQTQIELFKVKTRLKELDAEMIMEIATSKRFGNQPARDAELMRVQKENDDYKLWMKTRNDIWVRSAMEGVDIEFLDNQIKNLRVMLNQ
jgi:sulfatase maturation enzyme AslB (radical SAM superfamily)